MIQAGHGGEGVVDRGRHGPHSHLSELVDRVLDVLVGGAPVSDLDGAPKQHFEVLIYTGHPPR
jgi:hypothetical protein